MLFRSETALSPLFSSDSPPPLPPVDAPSSIAVHAAEVDATAAPGIAQLDVVRLIGDAIASSGTAYLPMLVLLLPTLFASLLAAFASTMGSFGIAIFINLLEGLCIAPLIGGATTFYAHHILTRRHVTIAAALRRAANRFVQLLLAYILVYAATFGGLLLCLIPGIYLSIRLAYTFYAVVIENRSATDAFRRSLTVTKGHWWPLFWALFGIFFFAGLLAYFIFAVALRPVLDLSSMNTDVLFALATCLLGPIGAMYYTKVCMTLASMADPNGHKIRHTSTL